jgi:hypothetical protein
MAEGSWAEMCWSVAGGCGFAEEHPAAGTNAAAPATAASRHVRTFGNVPSLFTTSFLLNLPREFFRLKITATLFNLININVNRTAFGELISAVVYYIYFLSAFQ